MDKDSTIAFLRECLQAIGSYSAAFEPLLDDLAMAIEIRDMAYKSLTEDGVTIEEWSREGDPRKRSNPAWPMFIESSKEVRAKLSSLQMTVATAKFTSGDEVDKLNQILHEALNEYTKPKRSTKAQSPARRKTAKR
ncbi:MAG: P27 family phage terminase small subunit [Porphyromonadaceae bacterium]|nr:P27 family phage terminase small subunit [Porphyromonadaceae bacterium]